MATDTTIEWADKTWSPIIGCDRVSDGCLRCYAINTAHIRSSNPNPKVAVAFAGTTHRKDGRTDWTGQINQLEDRLTQPLTWKKPRKVFVNSQSDLFHKNVTDEFIARVFAVMALTPQHTYQVLTKRHARMRALLKNPDFRLMCEEAEAVLVADEATPGLSRYQRDQFQTRWWSSFAKPLANLWLGVSVEDQHWADIRIPALLDTPAAVRWISAEPLLGPLWIADYIWQPCPCCHGEGHDEACAPCGDHQCDSGHVQQLDWVVAGGESGPGARPAHPDWFRSLRDQCTESHVPFLFKQYGDWAPHDLVPAEYRRSADDEKRVTYVHPDDGRTQTHGQWGMNDHAEGWARVQRVGKKAAGRELDGRTHDAFPAVSQ